MNLQLPTLYKKTSTGASQYWRISTQGNIIMTRWGQVDGAEQVTEDVIKTGKNIGKANETTPIQQAQAEAQSQWEKKLKKGYVKTLGDARAGKVDAVIEGGVTPMLAHRFDEQGHKVVYPAYVQPKFDGHRCIGMIDEDGKASLWSRTRKPITGLPHIIKALEKLAVDTGMVGPFDGELYVHQPKELGVEIPLTKGLVALVSPEDVDEVNNHKWSAGAGKRYAVRNQREDGKSNGVYMHRQLLDAPDGWDVDHKNGNGLDNRRSNLRLCSPSQNAGNQKKRNTNTSGFKGVYYFKRDGSWHAQITVAGKKIHLGYFSTPEEAADAYDIEAKRQFGEFALTNATSNLTFENLTSFIRNPEPKKGHEVVQYHIYDLAIPDLDFEHRYLGLGRLDRDGNPIVPVKTEKVEDEDELMLAFERFLEQGYEGLMVRNAAGLYVNKRSYDLLKVKEFQDREFKVVAVEEGRGKLAGHAIFVCEVPVGAELPFKSGAQFRAKMKGKIEDLKKYFDNPKLAVGKLLTVKYQGVTNKTGVPRFPVGIRIHEAL